MDGEQILWSGRPRQGLLFTAYDWFLIPFSVLWCGFAIVWEAVVLRSKAPTPMWLFGLPFIVIGLYPLVGRFAVDAGVRDRTRYALTNRRILIARSGTFGKLTSVSLGRLPDMQLSERIDGGGTIRFGRSIPSWGWPGGGGFGALDTE